MAIYRFKVAFEDYDDVIREIDIRSNQTFEDLHHAIQKSTGYKPEMSSSFYVCNDQWIKSDEIAYLPSARKVERGVALMEKSKMSSFIDDPHQKFYYTYNFDRPYDFHVELIKILDEEKGKEYPFVVRSVGEAPKPAGSNLLGGAATGAAAAAAANEFDFLNDMDFVPEDTEELEAMNDMGITAEESPAEEEEEEEKDEFMDEFSDNDNYDSEDFQKEDY